MDFKTALFKYDRASVIEITRDVLDSNYGVKNFYNDYVLDSLSSIGNEIESERYDIAQEHLCTAILRTVIEICYEYVLKEKEVSCNKSVIVSGLENELHELPPRISADYFTLKGFDTHFLGTNIPNEDVVSAILFLDVDYIAISVTNFLRLTNLRKLVEIIKLETNCKIIIGGLAVVNNMDYCKKLNVDYILSSFDEIGGILNETSD